MSVASTDHPGRVQSPARGEMVFLGESRTVGRVSDWARRLGYGRTSRPHAQLTCLVAEEDVLDGFCTPREAQILQHARTLGLSCLLPGEAREFLAGQRP